MVNQPPWPALRHLELAADAGDEAVEECVESELRPARIQMLDGFGMARCAGLRRKILASWLARAPGSQAGGELAGDLESLRLGALGVLDVDCNGNHVDPHSSKGDSLVVTHAGAETKAEGVVGHRVARGRFDAGVLRRRTSERGWI